MLEDKGALKSFGKRPLGLGECRVVLREHHTDKRSVNYCENPALPLPWNIQLWKPKGRQLGCSQLALPEGKCVECVWAPVPNLMGFRSFLDKMPACLPISSLSVTVLVSHGIIGK